MEHFKFASTITTLRKERKITQEQVANFLGVTKAAVSKWETGLSYPDITLLPKLATFYNLSIDELLGYKPQMTKEQILSLYNRLATDFTKKDFGEVYDEVLSICDEYYACFPLLLQMAVLLLNYMPPEKEPVIEKIFSLCKRIEDESNDVKLLRQTQSIKAYCYLLLNKPDEVLNVLGDIELNTGNDILIASSFQMLGNVEKAKETLQVSMFQNIINLLSAASSYLHIAGPTHFQEIVGRMESLIETFKLCDLHFNSVLVFYLSAAQGYVMQQKFDEAARMIQKYCAVSKTITITFPITLHGDEFFDLLDEWMLKEMDLGKSAPRDETSIINSIIQGVEGNLVFAPLLEREDVRMALLQLKHHLKGGK